MQEQAQETVQENLNKPAKQKLPAVLIAVIAVAGLLGLGGIGSAYGLLNKDYNGYLDKLKVMVAGDKEKFQNGDSRENATLADQYNFYASLKGEIGNLSVLLEKLNGNYTILPGRSAEKSLGISDLKAQMDGMLPKLATLKNCIDEDASVSKALAELLGADKSTDISLDMSALASRNDALDIEISGIAFSGAFEDRRAEFAAGIKKRGAALHYLEEDSAIQGELLALLSDVQTDPSVLAAKFKELGDRNDALEGKSQGIDLAGISPESIDFQAVIAGRREKINAGIAYLTELAAVQSAMDEFCQKLEGSPVPLGKFADRLASYMDQVKQLKALEDRLNEINGKPQYAVLETKRTVADLGITPAGETLLSYEPALDALNAGITASNDMEKQIDALLKNTPMTLPDKISTLVDMSSKNQDIINSLQNGVPDDLADGLSAFSAGCQERTVFLNEFMGYVEDKVLADGHNTQYKYYIAERAKYLEDADYYQNTMGEGPDGPDVKHYKRLANDQSALASAEKAGKYDCLKQAGVHQAAYEASRNKYQALFAG